MTIQKIDIFTKDFKRNLYVQDDTYYPAYGGGSKARKIEYFLKDAIQKNCNAIVTAGASNSNHARVVALACAQKGWKCTIIIHDYEDYSKGNLLIMKMSGAKLVFSSLNDVARLMEAEMISYKESGYIPYYIYGGGHGVLGSLSYYNAVIEVLTKKPDIDFDYIIHASGTGGTQAGLIVALHQILPKAKVLGVSIAREQHRGQIIVKNSCDELTNYLGISKIPSEKIIFRDDWIQDGYGSIYPDLIKSINFFAKRYGVITDPTYTGKAVHALLSMITSNEIQNGSKILFWHTGGLANLIENSRYLSK